MSFVDPAFGASGDEDPRLVWQEPLRAAESGGWGAPLTILEDGSFYGHAALRFRCHAGYNACVTPPAQDESLDQWLIGEAEPGVRTGPIYAGGTHGVDPSGRPRDPEWLARTSDVVADAAAGWDRHGLWVAGRLRPGLTDEQIARFRGSTLSGEWHEREGRLRLVGMLAVNGPGYLVRRAVAASGGTWTVGADCGCDMTLEDQVAQLQEIVASLLARV